jgi:hypothetical protein
MGGGFKPENSLTPEQHHESGTHSQHHILTLRETPTSLPCLNHEIGTHNQQHLLALMNLFFLTCVYLSVCMCVNVANDMNISL